jgi:DNA polymerase
MNLQNLVRGGELRLSILAAGGHAIAVCDSGQIEARVNAWLWGQDDLVEAFHLGRDIYCEFATQVYGRAITKADKLERHIGKSAQLGLGFGMGVDKFQMTLAKGALGGPRVNFPRDQCAFIVSTYRSANYKIAQGWKQCSAMIEDMAAGASGEHKCIRWGGDGEGNGWVALPNGMHLKYPNLKRARNDEKGFEEWSYQSGDARKKIYGGLLCENIVQALARIIVMEQMLMIDKKYRCVMTTHDEVVAHPRLRDAEKCYQFMYQCMITPLWWCPDIPLAAAGGWAENYSK